jgi:DNA repair protein RadC
MELISIDREILMRQGYSSQVVEALRSVRDAHHYLLTEHLAHRDLAMSRLVVDRYLRATLACGRVEQFHVIYVDGQNRYIDGQTHWTGTVNEVVCHIREILFSAIACGASGIILAHNHPSGALFPSQDDIALTHQIGSACHPLGLLVLDHFVVSRDGIVSMRDLGLMPDPLPSQS